MVEQIGEHLYSKQTLFILGLIDWIDPTTGEYLAANSENINDIMVKLNTSTVTRVRVTFTAIPLVVGSGIVFTKSTLRLLSFFVFHLLFFICFLFYHDIMVLFLDLIDIHSRFRKLHIQPLQSLRDNLRDGEIAEPFMIRGNDKPGGVFGAALV